MKIGEVVKVLNEKGESIRTISTQGTGRVNLSKNKLGEVLKAAGYVNQRKNNESTWLFSGDDREEAAAARIDIYEAANAQQPAATAAPKQRKQATGDTGNGFTPQEVKAIKELLRKFAADQGAAASQLTPPEPTPDTATQAARDLAAGDPLPLRINREVLGGAKVRKTLSLNKSIGDDFDDFAESVRLPKAALIEIALRDLINKYGGDQGAK